MLTTIASQASIAIENAHLYAEVERLATMDELTGIANRRKLFEMGQREFDRARRYGTPLAAILLDIDRFKKVNDTYGHLVGDEVLRISASRMLEAVRQYDSLGRYGGEEFLAVLPGCSPADAVGTAERMLEREVAIKQLVGSASDASSFRREARMLARIDHPHIVTVYDYRERDDVPPRRGRPAPPA